MITFQFPILVKKSIMSIKEFFRNLFLSSKTRRQQDLLNMLHDSGVIKIEGREYPQFPPSVLEIEDNINKDIYYQVSEILGKAILSNDFNEIQKYLSKDIVLTLYGKASTTGITEVINYFREWIDKFGQPCNGNKYKVRYCAYFNRIALEIKPFRAKPLFLVSRIEKGEIKDLFFAPNPLQSIMIRYWSLDNEALSFKKDPYLCQNLGEDLNPQQNRMPCMRCGTKSEKLQWYKYYYDCGPLSYNGELSICPNCMETVEYYPDTLLRKQ